MTKPLAIDLFCGLGGWTEGLLAEGYDVVGFDIEQHVYGEHRYPAQLVVQDVLTLHGSQFRDAALIVASPPCQAYSYRAMPWKRAKALPPPCNALFEACFRIQREACEAAGRHIPLVVENVRGAQPWVGPAKWYFGSFYLWGDVPALMPHTLPYVRGIKVGGGADGWFGANRDNPMRKHHSKHPARKAASAMIAKIPLPLSRWIAATYRPDNARAAA
jgi:C-5 cytosine-specific DNA methylase